MSDKDYYRGRDGYIYFMMTQPDGAVRRRGVCTWARTMAEARDAVEKTGVERLELLAQANALTVEAIELVTGQGLMTVENVVAGWRIWARATLADNSADLFATYVNAWVRDGKLRNFPMRKITEEHLNYWINDGQCRRAVVLMRYNSLKSLFRYANGKGFSSGNPMELCRVRYRDLTVAQLEKKAVAPIIESEYQTILAAFSDEWRDWVILSYCTGMRLGDCVMFQYESVTPQHVIVYPRKSRIGKRLALPVAEPHIFRPELADLVQRLTARRDPTTPYCWPLAMSAFLKDQQRFSLAFTKEVGRLGIRGKSFHSLRRGFIVRLNEAGITMEQIAQWVGHSSTEQTAHYIASKENL